MKTAVEPIPELTALGFIAFTTTRDAGNFSLATTDPVVEVMTRWSTLQSDLIADARGIALAPQIHGTVVIPHAHSWEGLLRTRPADGHATTERGIALAVTIADCVPIFLAHPPSGAVAILHSGWQGTAARIINEGIRTLALAGIPPDELHAHLGPSICGRCYEVSADVRTQLTGEPANRPGQVDLRSIILADARSAGIQHISISPFCTRCDNTKFFSHRAGDPSRQVAIITSRR